MSKIIYSTINGSITQEVVVPKATMYRTKIYVDDAVNLIGFRNRLPYHQDVNEEQKILTEYIEIEHFMGMLYDGLPKAFDLLYMGEDHIEFSTLEFDMLRKEAHIFLNEALIQNLLVKSKESFDKLLDEDYEVLREKEQEFDVKLFEYNKQNAYISLRNLMLVISVMKDEKYELTKSNNQVLQGIVDGLFSKTGVGQGYERYLNDIEEIRKNQEIPIVPDLEMVNELLLKIRNVEIIDKNIATAE